MNVSNMKSRSGNKVPNQFIIRASDGSETFQSYNSAIARRDADGTIHLSEHWDYSITTSKYRNEFLMEGTAETREKIKSGEYKMDLTLGGDIK